MYGAIKLEINDKIVNIPMNTFIKSIYYDYEFGYLILISAIETNKNNISDELWLYNLDGDCIWKNEQQHFNLHIARYTFEFIENPEYRSYISNLDINNKEDLDVLNKIQSGKTFIDHRVPINLKKIIRIHMDSNNSILIDMSTGKTLTTK